MNNTQRMLVLKCYTHNHDEVTWPMWAWLNQCRTDDRHNPSVWRLWMAGRRPALTSSFSSCCLCCSACRTSCSWISWAISLSMRSLTGQRERNTWVFTLWASQISHLSILRRNCSWKTSFQHWVQRVTKKHVTIIVIHFRWLTVLISTVKLKKKKKLIND